MCRIRLERWAGAQWCRIRGHGKGPVRMFLGDGRPLRVLNGRDGVLQNIILDAAEPSESGKGSGRPFTH